MGILCRAFRYAPHALIMESRVLRFGGADGSDPSDLSDLSDLADLAGDLSDLAGGLRDLAALLPIHYKLYTIN